MLFSHKFIALYQYIIGKDPTRCCTNELERTDTGNN